MAGLGFLGLVGGLGRGISDQAEYMQKQDDANAAFDRTKALEQWKLQQQQIYLMQSEDRAEARKAAPLNRLSAIAKSKLSEGVPVSADAVTNATAPAGLDPLAEQNSQGYLGTTGATAMKNMGPNSDSYSDLIARAQNLPEEDRAPYLAQIKRQMEAQQKGNQEAVAGKTRTRTNDEAFDAALEDAKVNDPQAYAAGKPLAAEKTMRLGANEALFDTKGKLLAANTRGAEIEAQKQESRMRMDAEREDRRDSRMFAQQEFIANENQKKIDAALEKADKRGGGAAGTQERIAYSNLLNETGRRLAEANKERAAILALGVPKAGSPEAATLSEISDRVGGLQNERKLYQQSLMASLGLPDTAQPSTKSAATSDNAAPNKAAIDQPKGPPKEVTQEQYKLLPIGTWYLKNGNLYRKEE